MALCELAFFIEDPGLWNSFLQITDSAHSVFDFTPRPHLCLASVPPQAVPVSSRTSLLVSFYVSFYITLPGI